MDKRVFAHYLSRMGWGTLLAFLFCGLSFYDGEVDSVSSVVFPVIWICLPISMEMKPGAGGSFRVHQALPVQSAFLRRFPFYIGWVAPMLMVLVAMLPWAIYRTVVGDTAFWMNAFAPVTLGMSIYIMAFALSMPLGHALKVHEHPARSAVLVVLLLAILFPAFFAIDSLWLHSTGRLCVVGMALGFAGLSWWLSPLMADGKTINLKVGKARRAPEEVKDRGLVGKLARSPEGRCALMGLGLFALMSLGALLLRWKLRGVDSEIGVGMFSGMFFMMFCILGFMYVAQSAGSMRSLAALPLSTRQLAAKIMRSALLILLGGLLGALLIAFAIEETVAMRLGAAFALYSVAVVYLALAAFYRVGFRFGYGVLLTFSAFIQTRLMLSEMIDAVPSIGWGDLLIGAVGALLGTWAIPRALESRAAYAPKQMPGQKV